MSIGILSLRRLARDRADVDAGVRGAVRQEHDRRRRVLRIRAAEQLERQLERVAGRGGSVRGLRVDDRARAVVVGRGRLDGVGRVREGDRADAHLRRQLIDERVRGALGGGQPRRLDVGRGHRAGVVGDEHHGSLLDRSAVADVRPCERERQRRDRRQREARTGGTVATSCRAPAASCSVETAGKADRVAPRAPARGDRCRDRERDQRERASQRGEAKLIAGGAPASPASPDRWRA